MTIHEVARAWVEFEDAMAAPLEETAPHEYGTPLCDRLRVYGPVTKWNVVSGARLVGMLYFEKLRSVERAFNCMPARRRREIEVEIRAIKIQRMLAELRAIVAELREALGCFSSSSGS